MQWRRDDDSVWCDCWTLCSTTAPYPLRLQPPGKRTARSCSNSLECIYRYEVYAFSRPDTLLACATYPLARFFQRKFRRDSAAAMALAAANCS